MKNFNYFKPTVLENIFRTRPGETRLGETVGRWEEGQDLKDLSATFAIVGIKEDIGIRANHGRPGAAKALDHLLPALLNVQSNRFLHGQEIFLAGYFEFPALMQEAEHLDPLQERDLNRLREMTAEIDTQVAPFIEKLIAAGKVPIVIGGGHNNAYPLIKGASLARQEPVDVLNIDPHADFRAREGRHSGNGFSYALADGYLKRYAVFGLDESYNNQNILEQFRASADLYYLSFDELLTFSTDERDRLFKDALRWLGPGPIGLELDLDSITGMPASAMNDSGLTMRQVRLLIKTAASLATPFYFHLAEGSPDCAYHPGQINILGKAMAHLITDFVKGCK